jgi:signal peptidase I
MSPERLTGSTTIGGAVAIVLACKAWVINPYRIPTSSMEPMLHCARPGDGCEAGTSDRVLANRFIYHFRDPERREIVVFKTPPLARQECGSEGTFVKRLIGLPGEVWEERSGFVYINGKKLDEPYMQRARRDSQTLGLADLRPRGKYTRIPEGFYLMMATIEIRPATRVAGASSPARTSSARSPRPTGRSDASAESWSPPAYWPQFSPSPVPSSPVAAASRTSKLDASH